MIPSCDSQYYYTDIMLNHGIKLCLVVRMMMADSETTDLVRGLVTPGYSGLSNSGNAACREADYGSQRHNPFKCEP